MSMEISAGDLLTMHKLKNTDATSHLHIDQAQHKLALSQIKNELIMHLYSALCIAVHPKRFLIMWGGLSSTTASVQHPLG